MRTVLRVALSVASAALVGCGSESGSSPGGSLPGESGSSSEESEANGLTAADDVFLTNFCTRTRACCAANGRSPDVQSCKTQYVAAGFTRDAGLQSQCLSELEGLASAAGAACVPEVSDLAGACSRMAYEPNGDVDPGQPCTSRTECAGEADSITLCVGVCIRMARGEAGDGTCLGDVSDEGVIVAAPASQTPPLPPISTGVLCERRAGLYCSFAQDKALQRCAPLRAGGVACDFSRSCASERCYNGDTTAGDLVGTCMSLVSAGQTCSSDMPTVDCDAASYCEISDTSGSGPLSGVCTARLPGGASCDADYKCLNDTCTDGSCKSTTDAEDVNLLGYCGF